MIGLTATHVLFVCACVQCSWEAKGTTVSTPGAVQLGEERKCKDALLCVGVALLPFVREELRAMQPRVALVASRV